MWQLILFAILIVTIAAFFWVAEGYTTHLGGPHWPAWKRWRAAALLAGLLTLVASGIVGLL